MARVYVESTPATRGEEPDSSSPGVVGPEGRFYRESADPKAEKARISDPIAQAQLSAGEPPTKAEIRDAKKEQKAAEKTDAPVDVVDTAAETAQEEPLEAASEAAGPPAVEPPGANASRDDWAEYARSQGATEADLVDAEGNPLRRNAIRDRYSVL